MKQVSRILLGLLLGGELGVGTPAANAQAVEARIGRFWDAEEWATYRVGLSRPIAGKLGVQLHGDVTRRFGGDAGGFAGLGADLTLFRKPTGGPYLVAGMSGGLGSESSNGFSDPWGSWSLGSGYDLFPLSFLSFGAEARWREVSLGGRGGPELAIGLAVQLGGAGGEAMSRRQPAASTPQPTVSPEPTSPQSPPKNLADSVVATATEAMGRPYEYGGTGEDGEGFDCSGLIQFAFGKHGITLPRRSTDQAREGTKVDRKLERLRTGDLLTFSNRGGAVTHVGLYVGGGRFIHSATKGVQISTLSAADPYGKWWYRRWVGVRRLIP